MSEQHTLQIQHLRTHALWQAEALKINRKGAELSRPKLNSNTKSGIRYQRRLSAWWSTYTVVGSE